MGITVGFVLSRGTDRAKCFRSASLNTCGTQHTLATVAHVRDANGLWWRFDDEMVTRMEDGPAGEAADHGISANKPKEKKVVCCCCSPLLSSPAGVLYLTVSVPFQAPAPSPNSAIVEVPSTCMQERGTGAAGPAAGKDQPQTIISSNAYMLMYRKRGCVIADRAANIDLPPRCAVFEVCAKLPDCTR